LFFLFNQTAEFEAIALRKRKYHSKKENLLLLLFIQQKQLLLKRQQKLLPLFILLAHDDFCQQVFLHKFISTYFKRLFKC
jgi:hypothetical protein